MTKGLPASGKSTWAKEYIKKHPNTKRVNKDDLRAMLDDGNWSRENEEFVLNLRDDLITLAIVKHHSVIVDDTNFAPKHEEKLRAVAKRWKVQFEVKDFTDVTPEVCIERDLKRPNSVGSKVIMKMYNQYLKPQPATVKYNPKLSDAIICDLDGTLAFCNGANWYDRDFTKDGVNEPIKEIVNNFAEKGYFIILVSGRKGEYENQTIKWIDKNSIACNFLLMRKIGDIRKDSIVKEEIYKKHIKGKYNIKFVLDDRNQVVDLWRNLGLTCLQVAEGDF